MYRNFIQGYRETIPSGLPTRLADPDLMAAGKPTFLRIGEGNEPRNELLRVVKQYPSKDEVRTKVLGEIFPPTDKDPYFTRPDNIAALRVASEELGIPIERTGLRIATHPFRLEGDVADFSLLADITNRAAGNLQRQGSPVLANALTRKAKFFNQPRSYRELAIDGSEGIDSIIAAYEKAEPRVTANSQGNRPILMQADGLDPNIGIPSGSPENIPPMDIEGLRGAYAYKPADELKRPRFIDMGYGVYTRSGEPINAEQKNLLDMGMADLEDRSFILRDPKDLARQPARALASQLPANYYGAERDIPTGVDAIIRGFGRRNPKTGLLEGNVNAQGYLQTDLPANYYGIPRDIPTELRAEYGRTGRRGLTPTRDELPLTREIGSIIGSQLNREQYRPTTRLGLQTLGLNADIGSEIILPAVDFSGMTLFPEERIINRTIQPINRLTDDLSDRVLSGEVDLRNYEPFKSNNTPQYYLDQSKEFVGPIRGVKNNTYGAREGKIPWREYYSDPFVYEDKGIDNEVNRLIKAVNEAPAQLENAYTQQAQANRRAIEASDKLKFLGQHPSVRMGLLPQSEGVVNLAREVRKDRRMAEIDAAKASDTIAQLKAAQELMGVEYMVKPKLWGNEVLDGYRLGSRTIGGIRDSNEVPTNDRFSEEVLDKLVVFQDPSLVGGKSARRLAKPNNWTVKPNAVQMWREALQQEALNNRRDYDIASTFGFSGNY